MHIHLLLVIHGGQPLILALPCLGHKALQNAGVPIHRATGSTNGSGMLLIWVCQKYIA